MTKIMKYISHAGLIINLIIVGSIIMVSCNKDEIPVQTDGKGITIQLTPSLINASTSEIPTRAVIYTGSEFTDDLVTFGVWLSKYDSSDPIMTGTSNMKSEYNPSSKIWNYYFDNEKHGELSIREGLGFSVNACYPYQEKDFDGVTDVTLDNVPFTTGKYDYLWAEPVSVAGDNVHGDQVNCELKFHHVMSCICLKIKCDHSSSLLLTSIDLTDTMAEEEGTNGIIYSKGHFDASTGELKTVGAITSKTITINNIGTTLYSNQIASVYILIPPMSGYVDNRFELTMHFNGVTDTEILRLPSAMKKGEEIFDLTEFKAGFMYTYQIEFDNNIAFIAPTVYEGEWGAGETTRITL